MKGFKRFLGVFAGLFVLVLLTGGILLWNFDPNDYTPQIVQLVKDKTGRILHIQGTLHLSFWPQLALHVNQVSLDNLSNPDPLITIKQASIHIKLFPLLKRHLAIHAMILDGVQVALVRQADGHGNWENLLVASSSSDNKQSGWIKTWDLQTFHLRQSQFSLDDQSKKERYACSELDLEVLHNLSQVHIKTLLETPQIKHPLEINTQLVVQPEQIALQDLRVRFFKTVLTGSLHADHPFTPQAHLTGQLQFEWSPPQHQVKHITAKTNIDATLSQVNLNALRIDADQHALTMPHVSFNLQQQKLDNTSFILNIQGINLNGDLKGTRLFTQPSLSGQLKSEPFDLSQTLKNLNLFQPTWPLKQQQATLKTQFEVTPETLEVKQFTFSVADHQLRVPQLRFHVTQHTLTSEEMVLDTLEKKLSAKVKLNGTELFKQPQWSGELTLTSSPFQEVLTRLGLSKWPAHQAHAKAQFNVTNRDILFKEVQITIDEHQFSSPQINFSLPTRRLTIHAWQSKILNVIGEGNISVEALASNDYQVQGHLRLAEFNLRKVLEQLGQPIPTTDKTVLNKVTLETSLKGTRSQLGLDLINLRWDDSQLKGKIDLKGFNPPQVQFNLNLDHIDIPRYLPPPSSTQDKTTYHFVSIFKNLNQLNLDGSVNIARLKMTNLEMTQVNLIFKGQQQGKNRP